MAPSSENPVAVIRDQRRLTDGRYIPDGRGLWVWCPGCRDAHVVRVVGADGFRPQGPVWDWDGDLEHPTISPSLLVHSSVYLHNDGSQCPDWHADYEEQQHTPGNCHSFIRAGRWQFLADSAHTLAGQAVDMVPVPDWLVA